MSNEKVRREFEAKFHLPFGVEYFESWPGYMSIQPNPSSYMQIVIDRYRDCFLGYQAAHQSRQAEIDRLTLELAECKKAKSFACPPFTTLNRVARRSNRER